MMDDDILVDAQIPGLPLFHRGKVRDTYLLDEKSLLMVATDRVSAFDVVFSDPIPGKGKILTRLSRHWFGLVHHIVAHHGLDQSPYAILARYGCDEPWASRAMVVQKLQPIPIEAVVRGYLAGSGWNEYRVSGKLAGNALPSGLLESGALPTPLFTPATKAPAGAHDVNITSEQAGQLIGADLAKRIEGISLEIYHFAHDYSRRRGLILADTKFEFGLDAAGKLFLIDELLTPDSSRFWIEESWHPGMLAPSLDKQIIRNYVEQSGWNKQPPPPALPPDIIAQTSEAYASVAQRLLKQPE